jgi:hypothetical protein
VAYATVLQLNTALGYTPNNAAVLLDRASRDVDDALLCSVYPVDATGNPTDTTHITALKDATLEQVAYQLEQGNTSGIRHGMQSGVPTGASAGSVDLSRGQSVGGNTTALPDLGDQAWKALRTAKLVPAGPRSR